MNEEQQEIKGVFLNITLDPKNKELVQKKQAEYFTRLNTIRPEAFKSPPQLLKGDSADKTVMDTACKMAWAGAIMESANNDSMDTSDISAKEMFRRMFNTDPDPDAFGEAYEVIKIWAEDGGQGLSKESESTTGKEIRIKECQPGSILNAYADDTEYSFYVVDAFEGVVLCKKTIEGSNPTFFYTKISGSITGSGTLRSGFASEGMQIKLAKLSPQSNTQPATERIERLTVDMAGQRRQDFVEYMRSNPMSI